MKELDPPTEVATRIAGEADINTEEMVRDQAWEFLFTLGPARITGGVQAIVNPIAIK